MRSCGDDDDDDEHACMAGPAIHACSLSSSSS